MEDLDPPLSGFYLKIIFKRRARFFATVVDLPGHGGLYGTFTTLAQNLDFDVITDTWVILEINRIERPRRPTQKQKSRMEKIQSLDYSVSCRLFFTKKISPKKMDADSVADKNQRLIFGT